MIKRQERNDMKSTSVPRQTQNTADVKHLVAESHQHDVTFGVTLTFSFIFGIDHSRDSAFVDGIFTLEKKD